MNLFKKLVIPILLFGLLAFAFLLRSKMLLHGDFYYLLDQSRDLLLTKSIVVDHKLTLIGARTGLGGLFHGALWIYMIAPFFVLAKGDPFLTLAPLFEVVNLGVIVVGFFVGRALYGKWMGLLCALLLTLSSPLVGTVPFTSNAQVLPAVVLLYVYAIMKYIRGSDKHIILALLMTGVGFQFESAFAVLLIPLTVVAVVLRGKLPSLKNGLLGLVAFLLAVSTFILFDLRHGFLMMTGVVRLFTNPTRPLPGYEQFANLGFRVQDRFSILWGSLFSPLFTADAATSWLLIAVLGVAVFSLIRNIFRARIINGLEKEFLYILLSPIVVFGIYVLYPLPLWPHYVLPITALVVVMLALASQFVWEYGLGRILVGVFLVAATLPALTWIQSAYVNSSAYIPASDGSYRNQLEVARWVLADSKNQGYGYFVYTTGILTYNMDYLLWWQSRKYDLIAPSNLKHPVTYLIMYPHSTNDNGAYTFWKKHVVRTNGKVLRTKNFTSGIVVEKLAIPANEQPADPNYYQGLIFR